MKFVTEILIGLTSAGGGIVDIPLPAVSVIPKATYTYYQSTPTDDSLSKRKEEFRREWTLKLNALQTDIQQKKLLVNKEPKKSRSKLLQELNDVEKTQKDLELEVNNSEKIGATEWLQFETDIQAQYDEIEKKVRNFFVK